MCTHLYGGLVVLLCICSLTARVCLHSQLLFCQGSVQVGHWCLETGSGWVVTELQGLHACMGPHPMVPHVWCKLDGPAEIAHSLARAPLRQVHVAQVAVGAGACRLLLENNLEKARCVFPALLRSRPHACIHAVPSSQCMKTDCLPAQVMTHHTHHSAWPGSPRPSVGRCTRCKAVALLQMLPEQEIAQDMLLCLLLHERQLQMP